MGTLNEKLDYLKETKSQIKEAVKNINNELEDAQREFDKLFKVDKEYE